MEKYIKETKKTITIYDINDIDSLIETKKLFNHLQKKAKQVLKFNTRNYNAKVDVCFYRPLYNRVNKILLVNKKKYIDKPYFKIQKYAIESNNNRTMKEER